MKGSTPSGLGEFSSYLRGLTPTVIQIKLFQSLWKTEGAYYSQWNGEI